MKQTPGSYQLSAQDKRVLNILQIKMYDIAQNVELVGKQFTNNQIKDVVANTYNIFCQLRRIFQNTGVPYLFEITRKMQVDSIVLISILTQRLDKKANDTVRQINLQQKLVEKAPKIQKNLSEEVVTKKTAPSKLGGIHLYNQCYARGLEYFQVTDAESLEQLAGKCRIKQSKKLKQQFMNTISRQIQLKAEVQMENASEQITNFIKEYKQNTKINSFISYQKELIEIIDFFKVSQLEAMTFLNKSPNNHDYTEDYINRMNDLEKDFKLRQKTEKKTITQKLKDFIINLKKKIHQTQQKYLQKANQLALYQKSLKKQTNTLSTQTYDGYQVKIKEQQQTIKQLHEKYKILTQIKSKELDFQSKYYEIHHELNLKMVQINKIKTLNTQIQDQSQLLKKIIRQNKEKLNVDLKQIQKKRNKNKKIIKSVSKHQIQGPTGNNNVNINNLINEDYSEIQRRASRLQKKTKKIERVSSRNSTHVKSVQLSEIQREINSNTFEDSPDVQQSFRQTPKKMLISPTASPNKVEVKQSVFKNQYKKNSKKINDQQRKVSFIQDNQALNEPITQKSQSKQVTPMNVSIDNIKNDQTQYENSPNNSRKNTQKQFFDSKYSSLKSIDQNKKSSKSISKKCIILKDNKQKDKSVLATTIKFQNLSIVKQIINMKIYPLQIYNSQPSIQISKPTNPIYQRRQRPSIPLSNSNSQQFSVSSIKSSNKLLNQHIFDIMSKMKSNNNAKQKLNTLDNSQRSSFIDIFKRQNILHKINLINLKNDNQIISASNNLVNMPKNDVSPKFQGLSYQKLKKIQRPKAHLEKHRKDIAEYLDKIKEKNRQISIDKQAGEQSYQKWRGDSQEDYQADSIAEYIIEELEKQQLNVQQFKQIAKLLQEQQRQYPLTQNNSSQKIDKKIVPIFKQFETKSFKKQGNKIKGKSQLKKKQNKQPNDKKQSPKELKDQIYGIGEHIYLKIRETHKKLSKCHNQDNQPCQHLIKYLSIIRNVNQIGSRKSSLKMHIQKIGQQNQPHKRSLEDIKHLQRSLQHQKMNKSNYIRANIPTLDQFIQQQRQRILPIISTTTSSYYKPKHKLSNK